LPDVRYRRASCDAGRTCGYWTRRNTAAYAVVEYWIANRESKHMSKWEDVEGKVRGYIMENLLFTSDGSQLANDASLLERSIIDSTGVLEIVLFLEEEFGVKISESEMIPENFDSVNNIVRFVQRLKATR
jgi:acyl carrier protein